MIGTRTRRVNACSRTGSAATRAPARARRPLPARSIPRPSWRRGPASRGRRASGSARAPRRQVAPPGRGRPCWATAWRTMRRAPRRRAAWPCRPLPGPLAGGSSGPRRYPRSRRTRVRHRRPRSARRPLDQEAPVLGHIGAAHADLGGVDAAEADRRGEDGGAGADGVGVVRGDAPCPRDRRARGGERGAVQLRARQPAHERGAAAPGERVGVGGRRDPGGEHRDSRRVGREDGRGGGEAFELEARGRLAEQVCQRVGHGVERVAGDAAPGRDVDGDARGVPRQPVELEVDVAPLDPVERISACPARDGAGQDAGVLAGDDRVARAVAEYGGVDFERLHGVSFRFQGDRGPETGPLSDVSSMAYTLKAPRLTCRPCASRRHRSPRGRMPPPSGARPRRRRPGRRTRYRWAMPSPHHAWRSPRR